MKDERKKREKAKEGEREKEKIDYETMVVRRMAKNQNEIILFFSFFLQKIIC